jgi:ethanolamine ammonia-lyase small subunit
MKEDVWTDLQAYTAARIALGRSGGSMPTAARLQFQLAHAQARDAVHAPFDATSLAQELAGLSLSCEIVQSEVRDRAEFLLNPEGGRLLREEDRLRLASRRSEPDLVIVVSDGLSSHAAHRQVPILLEHLLPMLSDWNIAPIVIARYGRVALQDDIGEALGASWSLMLLGERPGLGSPDSLGAYFTYQPRRGKNDAERNCVSNIRPEGLPPKNAALLLHSLLSASRRLGLSGVNLKDDAMPFLGSKTPDHSLLE